MDSLCSRVADGVLRAPSDPDGKLLERCPFWKHELEPSVRQPLLRVRPQAHAGLPQLPESLRAQPRKVHEPGQRQQSLVGRDVRGRLLSSNVLLTGLEGEDIAALCPSPMTRPQPYVPGASSTPRETRSTCATGRASASFAAAASSGAGSRQPKKFGCWKMTQAASVLARRSSSGSVVPPRWGTSTISSPKPGA